MLGLREPLFAPTVVDLSCFSHNLSLLGLLLVATVLSLLLLSTRSLLCILIVLFGKWAVAGPMSHLATIVARLVVSCLRSGYANARSIRLGGALLIRSVRSSSSSNYDLLMRILGTCVVSGMVYDFLALLMARRSS